MRIILSLILLLQSIPVWSRDDLTLNARITQFEELQRTVLERCVNNPTSAEFSIVVDGQTLNCRDLLNVVHRLKAEIDRDVTALEASCAQPTVDSNVSQVTQASLRAAREAGSCPVQSRDSQCMGQVGCAALSVAVPIMGVLAGALGPSVRQCSQVGTACMQNFFRGIIDSIWSTLTAIWDLGRMGVTSARQALGLVSRSERATSERAMAAQQVHPSILDQFRRDPVGSLRRFASNVFQGLKTAAMNSYGCEQWSGRAFDSQCIRPMTNWDCASCQQKITVFCGIGGIAAGEIVTGFLTGGMAAGAAFIARGVATTAKAVARGARVSRAAAASMRAAQSTLRTIPRSAEGLAEASRLATRAAATGGRVLSATERRAVRAWNAITAHPVSRSLDRAFTAAGASPLAAVARGTLKPVAIYLDAIQAATVLGFRMVDNGIAAATGRNVIAAEVVQATAVVARASETSAEIAHDVHIASEAPSLTVQSSVATNAPAQPQPTLVQRVESAAELGVDLARRVTDTGVEATRNALRAAGTERTVVMRMENGNEFYHVTLADGRVVHRYDEMVQVQGRTERITVDVPMDAKTLAIDSNFGTGKAVLQAAVNSAQGSGSVVFVDVNHLGLVNYFAALGTQGGDEYLEAVAAIMRSQLREGDMVFKNGGDELVLVLANNNNPESVREISQRITNAVDRDPGIRSLFRREVTRSVESYRELNRASSLADISAAQRSRLSADELAFANINFPAFKQVKLAELQTAFTEQARVRGSISIGSTLVGPGDNVSMALHRAEAQAGVVKARYKAAQGLDVSKYRIDAFNLDNLPSRRSPPIALPPATR